MGETKYKTCQKDFVLEFYALIPSPLNEYRQLKGVSIEMKIHQIQDSPVKNFLLFHNGKEVQNPTTSPGLNISFEGEQLIKGKKPLSYEKFRFESGYVYGSD